MLEFSIKYGKNTFLWMDECTLRTNRQRAIPLIRHLLGKTDTYGFPGKLWCQFQVFPRKILKIPSLAGERMNETVLWETHKNHQLIREIRSWESMFLVYVLRWNKLVNLVTTIKFDFKKAEARQRDKDLSGLTHMTVQRREYKGGRRIGWSCKVKYKFVWERLANPCTSLWLLFEDLSL